MMRLAALAFTATASAVGAQAPRGDAAFVVSYRCDGERWIAVGYPAFRDAAHAPIRVAWDGRTVLMMPARAGSGARYTSESADLQWWSKGRDGFLDRLSDNSSILKNCAES